MLTLYDHILEEAWNVKTGEKKTHDTQSLTQRSLMQTTAFSLLCFCIFATHNVCHGLYKGDFQDWAKENFSLSLYMQRKYYFRFLQPFRFAFVCLCPRGWGWMSFCKVRVRVFQVSNMIRRLGAKTSLCCCCSACDFITIRRNEMSHADRVLTGVVVYVGISWVCPKK